MNMYMRGLKNRVSDVLSLPSRLKAKKVMKQADKDVSVFKKARMYKDTPDFDYKDNPMKDAINARSEANEVRYRLKKNVK